MRADNPVFETLHARSSVALINLTIDLIGGHVTDDIRALITEAFGPDLAFQLGLVALPNFVAFVLAERLVMTQTEAPTRYVLHRRLLDSLT